MAIETICPGCSRKLRVGDEFAGKQARCPVCSEIYSVSGAAVDSPQTSNEQTWRLKTPEGQIYGPVSKDEMDKWVTDGRVTSECFLAPDESNWDRADALYPVLRETLSRRVGTGATESPVSATQPARSPYGSASATTSTTRYRYAAAHRGGLILALGVISWVVGCPIFGLFAWIMGSNDLREMRLGRMDPSGMGLTQAGQIIGMIHSILVIVVIVIAIFFMLMAVAVS